MPVFLALAACKGSEAGHAASLPADPDGSLLCGAAGAMKLDENICCVDIYDGGAYWELAIGNACGNNAASLLTVYCDSPTDCQGQSTTCCIGREPGGGTLRLTGTYCGAGCSPLDYGVVCKTDDDCGDAGPCVVQPCSFGLLGVCGKTLATPGCIPLPDGG